MNKKTKFRYFLTGSLIVIAAIVVGVYSCEKRIFTPQTDTAISDDPTRFITEPGAVCGKILDKRIMKDQETSVGEALVYNDGKYFYVLLNTKKGYLKDAYMHVSSKYGSLPMTEDGTPIIEKFNNKITGERPSNLRKFRIPLTELSGTSYISVAAEYVQNLNNNNQKVHITWVEGKFFGTTNPAQIFDYKKQICYTDDAVSDDPKE
jgi:hypothetical protein